MATIDSLHIYPIKSCRGIDLIEGRLGAKGLEVNGLGDQQWVVSDATGLTVTQRECPRLALVAPRASSEGMIVSAPGMADLSVAIDRESRRALVHRFPRPSRAPRPIRREPAACIRCRTQRRKSWRSTGSRMVIRSCSFRVLLSPT